jgi:NhaP-type Na+/H+ or K+/H+ antiporter
VAALTMIKPGEYPKLFSIVFGEGMINDAVAIILFRSVEVIFDEKSHEPFNAEKAKEILLSFIGNLFYSFLIGVGSGLLCAFIFKKARFLMNNVVAEVMLSFFFGLFAYSFAEFCEYSGVIAVFICGITMGHYNFYNLSTNGKISTGYK